MFVGHLALGLAAKRAAPSLSLGWLIAAPIALDLLWPFFLFAGVEHVRIAPGATAFTPLIFDAYPWSHSLVMTAVWGLLLAGAARARGRQVYILIALVASHWLLDFVSHAPDMPLWPGRSPRLGLGLWYSIPATLVVEGALWIAGIVIYLRGRRSAAAAGPIAFWTLVVLCTTLWAASPWSPPPPSARVLASFGLISWIIAPWAAFADRHYTANRQLIRDQHPGQTR